jgi:hypothetical protein
MHAGSRDFAFHHLKREQPMKKRRQSRAFLISLCSCIIVTGCALDDDAAVLETARGLPVPGAVLWLRADRGVQRDALGKVIKWSDQSKRDNHAIASVRPLWLEMGTGINKPAIQFSGTEYFHLPDFMRSPDVTAFFVCRCPQQVGQQYLFSDYGDVLQKRFYIRVLSAADTMQFMVQDIASVNMFTNSINDSSAYHILTARIEYQTIELYYNGAFDNSNSDVSYDPTTTWEGSMADMYPTIGRDSDPGGMDFLIGEVAEVIFYNTALSSDDRSKIERQLSEKYGIPLLH